MEAEGEKRSPFQFTRCFCWSLRQGTIIIAALEVTTFFSFIALLAVVLANTRDKYEYVIKFNDLLEVIINFLISIPLVIGVWKERRQLLWAWVYTRALVLLTDAVSMLLASALLRFMPYVVFSVVVLPVYVACIAVVRSYCLQLKARDNQEPTGTTSDATAVERSEAA